MNVAQRKKREQARKSICYHFLKEVFSGPLCEKDRAQFTIIGLIITLLNFQVHD
jgi:hypothetical protein